MLSNLIFTLELPFMMFQYVGVPGAGLPYFDLPSLLIGILAAICIFYSLVIQNDVLLLVATLTLIAVIAIH
jgi:hypothetical protein